MTSGARIKQVRELTGLSQIALAKLVGVTQPMVSMYEKGLSEPSEETLQAISLCTKFPMSFFRQEPFADYPLGLHLFYRARSSMTVRDRTSAHRWAELVYEGFGRLGARFEPMDHAIPRLEEPPARAAEMTRSALGLSPDKPIDNLVRTLERAAVRVLVVPLSLDDPDAFSAWVSDPDGRETRIPTIAILTDRTADRCRFSIAHEVGHLVLHGSGQGRMRDFERQANDFGAEFLMPEVAMRQELIPPITLTDLAKLKPRWKVSMQALAYRARDLDIITTRQMSYLFKQLSAKGLRKREPENLDVPSERPRLFRKLAEVLYGNPIDVPRMARDLAWTEQITRKILDAHTGCNGLMQSAKQSGNVLQFNLK